VKAAVVYALGASPTYREFEEPVPRDDEVRVAVTASALTNFTKLRAAGAHYSSSARPPFVPGIDGVGRLDDGTAVYFLFPRAPFGGMAEFTVARRSTLIPAPDGLDDVTLAAIADPGMSAWAALQERARLRPGETVMINGATGTAGALAVQIAKHLGAARVVASGRNTEILASLEASVGADAVIDLGDEAHLNEALRDLFADGVDVVLDYLWGASAERILAAAAAVGGGDRPVRFIQIGTTSAPTITLPGAPLHSSAIEIKGSGVGSVHPSTIAQILRDLVRAAPGAGFRVATRPVPLTDVEAAWSIESATPRIVFTVAH
jgi:NADPH:quinone reductase-like Zn-dependent oxidoreductase